MKRFIRILLKAAGWGVFASGLLVLLAFLVLFLFEFPVPRSLVDRMTSSLSGATSRVTCGDATFGLRRGLCFRGIAWRDLTRRDQSRPAASAEEVALTFLPLRVRIAGARFDRLGDAYYTGAGSAAEPEAAVEPLAFPPLPGFELELEGPSILGVAPARLVCDVEVSSRRLEARHLCLEWPAHEGIDEMMSLQGSCTVDLEAMRLTGGLAGTALQEHIRPLLVALDLPSSLPYMDAFTEVRGPVRSGCSWDVDLATSEYTLDIPLHPNMGRYNGVKMSRTDGGVGVHVAFPPGAKAYDIRVGPLTAYDESGRLLDGTLCVHGTNDLVNLSFDARSDLPMASLLDVMGVLNDGTLDCLVCEAAPKITARGVFATDPERERDTDFGGEMRFRRCTFLGLSLHDVAFDYRWKGPDLVFTNLVALGNRDGHLNGAAVLSLPERDPERARFRLDVEYENGRLGELSGMTTNDMASLKGKVDGAFHFTGPLSTNALAGLCGYGRVDIYDGRLAQLRLFLGLTDLLAKAVPGVSQIINLSDASASFTLVDGVLRTEDAVLEGPLISLAARGSYDLVKDQMGFLVSVRFLKEESWLAKYVVLPVNWAVSKILELELTGSLNNPRWSYFRTRGPDGSWRELLRRD